MRHCGDYTKTVDCSCLICFNKQCVCSYGKLCLRCSSHDQIRVKSFYRYNKNAKVTNCRLLITWTDVIRRKKVRVVESRDLKLFNYIQVI